MTRPSLFFSLTMTLWLGIYALRTYVPAAVWNLADELPLALKPAFAVGTHLLGTLGLIIIVKYRRRALLPVAMSFAAVTVLRQVALTVDAIGPYLSMLSWVLWVMLMAALADEVAAHDEEHIIAPALLCAFALQIGMQSAWHGLDLPSVSGWLSILAAIALAAVLLLSIRNVPVPLLKRPHTSVAWLLLGPAFFLQVTFAANLGRFGEVTGFTLAPASALLIAATIVGVVLGTRPLPRWARLLLAAFAALAVFAMPRVAGIDGLVVLPVQIAIAAGLTAAATRRVRMSGASACVLGALFLFILIFGFYNYYEVPILWGAALLPLLVVMWLDKGPKADARPVTVPLFAGAVLVALAQLIPAQHLPVAAHDTVRVLSYNIHHGFDDDGVPGMRATADEIASFQPDLVALQEIGRGWTLIGGSDLVAYLRWRFPDYQVHFTPTNGRLWGNAVMSRLPVRGAEGGVFDAEAGDFKYGWTGMSVTADTGELAFYSVHLTADLEGRGGDARVDQAQQLRRLIARNYPLIVAGDFNAEPGDAPVKVLSEILVDLGSESGIGGARTWPAGDPQVRIDYIFAAGLTVRRAQVKQTVASDHLPVFIEAALHTTRPGAAASNAGSAQAR